MKQKKKNEITVVLLGNPNAGKSALMNVLAGTKAKVGNWPGVTVEKKEGSFSCRGKDVKLIDLPGVYSLSSYTLEEQITKDFLQNKHFDVVLNVVDPLSLSKSLYLTLELLDMGLSPIIAIGKVDELKKRGIEIDTKKLSELTGAPVVSFSAYTKKGLRELKKLLLNPPNFKARIPRYHPKLESAVEKIKKFSANRWMALKALERDPDILNLLSAEARSLLESLEIDPLFVQRERFKLAEKISESVLKRTLSPSELDERLDKVLTNPISGAFIFFLSMSAVFTLTFKLGQPLGDFANREVLKLTLLLSEYFKLPAVLKSLLCDGLAAGVGAVLSLLPVLTILYILLALLEDSGYMARAAALWDSIVRKFGISGSSVIPLILGFGCNVPAVYATRTIKSHKEKIATLLMIPWMSCGARLAVYTVFVSAFFSSHQAEILLLVYFIGIAMAIAAAFLFSRLSGLPDEGDFFIELPPFKIPSLNVIFYRVYVEISEFLKEAGSIIILASSFVWALAFLPVGVSYASKASFAGKIGKALKPIFKPLGINDWRLIVALLFGAVAKEVIVSTLGTLFGSHAALHASLKNVLTAPSAISYLIFVLLYIPCVATVAAIKRESGSVRFVLALILFELLSAWAVAFLAFNLAKMFS